MRRTISYKVQRIGYNFDFKNQRVGFDLYKLGREIPEFTNKRVLISFYSSTRKSYVKLF